MDIVPQVCAEVLEVGFADGAAERRQVGRGRIDGPWQFIEKGLEKGERIVADGGHKVRKGMTIVPAPFRP